MCGRNALTVDLFCTVNFPMNNQYKYSLNGSDNLTNYHVIYFAKFYLKCIVNNVGGFMHKIMNNTAKYYNIII